MSEAARARSAGTVTLRLVGSPGTTWTGILQASRSAASSVHRPSAARGSASAARRSARRTPWGVWARANLERSSVATTWSPSIRLTVSLTGRTGMAAPCSAAATATRAASPSARIGRAPSWTSTTRSPAASGTRASRAWNPAATESCRIAPPATTASTCGGSQGAAARSSRRSGAVTTTTCSRPGVAAIAASVCASSGRPASGQASLSTPAIRLEEPAATTMASLGGGTSGAVNPAAVGRRSSGRRPSGGRA